MRYYSFIFAFLFAFLATSYAWSGESVSLEIRKEHGNSTEGGKGHHNGTRMGMGMGDSTKKECKQIRSLTTLTKLAANQTKLDELVADKKMTTAMVDALKAKAAKADTTLKTLTANSTLTGQCAVIDANEKTMSECKEMKHLKKLSMIAGNQTALTALMAKKHLNATETDKFKMWAMKAQEKYQKLSSNATLTKICAEKKQEKGSNDG